MGSAAAWQLTQSGQEVILIEQQDTEYTSGSSFGEARICRSLGPKYDIWSYIHQKAVSEAQELIQFLNTHKEENHSMQDIYTTSPVTYIYYTYKVEAAKRMLSQQSDPYQFAGSIEEAQDKFGIQLEDGQIVVREAKPYSGTMNPKALIKKMQTGVRLKGNTIRFNERVNRVEKLDEGYRVELINTIDGSLSVFTPKKLVIAAGPYIGQVCRQIAPYLGDLIVPKQVSLIFLKIDPNRYNQYSKEQRQKIKDFFPILDMGPDHMFAMIENMDEEGNPIIKVGGHYLRKDITDLDNTWKTEPDSNDIEWGKHAITQYFRVLDIPLDVEKLQYVHGYSCVYSLTGSEVALVSNLVNEERMPDPNCVIVGGMSGVGAKGALTYGLMAKNLLMDEDDSDPMYQRTKTAMGFDRLVNDLIS